MRINIQNMLRQAANAIPRKRDSGAYRYVLGQLAGHLLQLRDRTQACDLTALDEFFKLYVFDDGKEYSRPTSSRDHESHSGGNPSEKSACLPADQSRHREARSNPSTRSDSKSETADHVGGQQHCPGDAGETGAIDTQRSLTPHPSLLPQLTPDQRQALEWARGQNFGTMPARYAKLCAQAYDQQSLELAREVGTRAARAAEIDSLRHRMNELVDAASYWRRMYESASSEPKR